MDDISNVPEGKDSVIDVVAFTSPAVLANLVNSFGGQHTRLNAILLKKYIHQKAGFSEKLISSL